MKVYHPTGIEDYLRCPRKFYYKTINIQEDIEESVDLIFGRCIHAGVAYFYKEKRDLMGIIQAFRKDWPEDFQGSEKKNLMVGLAVMEAYYKNYINDPIIFKPEHVECTQPIEMPNGTFMQGTLDRISISSNDYTMITDTKTTTMPLTDYWFRNFENSFQLGAYYHITLSIFDHCDAVQIDGIRVPLKGKEDFNRRSWPRTEIQQKEWLNTYLKCTDEIEAAGDNIEKFVCNPTSCGDYSGCQFLSLCTLGNKL